MRHEDEFCPVTCSIFELEQEIKQSSDIARKSFFEGVFHARVIISAATNGSVAA